MRPRTGLVCVLVHSLLFGPLAVHQACHAQNVTEGTVALRTVMKQWAAHRSSQASKPRLTKEEFLKLRGDLAQRFDQAIRSLDGRRISDQALRRKARKALLRRFGKMKSQLGSFVRKELSEADVADIRPQLEAESRYQHLVWGTQGDRDLLRQCVEADLDWAIGQFQRKLAHLTKTDLLASLKQQRAMIDALPYDNGAYDEFFEFCLFAFKSDDAIWFLFGFPLFLIDLALVPIVALYKFAHWWIID